MNRRIVMAALATIALSACDRAIETDPALAELIRILYARTDAPGFWPTA